MTTRPGPQRKDEVSRQRGYGEDRNAKENPDNAEQTDLPGFRGNTGKLPGDDHGVFRDDGQPRPNEEIGDRPEDLVKSPSDERHPTPPETMNADQGEIDVDRQADDADTTPEGEARETLRDEMNRDDPTVRPKS
jgi:hypothetical protein